MFTSRLALSVSRPGAYLMIEGRHRQLTTASAATEGIEQFLVFAGDRIWLVAQLFLIQAEQDEEFGGVPGEPAARVS